jgi:hypothetical protein
VFLTSRPNSRYDQGVFGGVIVTPDFLNQLGIAGDATMQSTVTAIYDVGCFLGAVSTIWIGERLGRRRTVMLGTTVMSVGAVLQISAFGVPQMIVGRVVAGIGNGMNTSTAPVWQGETSKASWRGKLIVIEMIMNIFGFMLSKSPHKTFPTPKLGLPSVHLLGKKKRKAKKKKGGGVINPKGRQLGYVRVVIRIGVHSVAFAAGYPVPVHICPLWNRALAPREP